MTLPYAGTSGWSGSDTSRERALAADSSGETADRQDQTLAALRTAAWKGLTYQELGSIYGWHHGKSSGVLSTLHKAGQISRLQERRNRCAIYVLPQFVGARTTAAHGRKRRPSEIEILLTEWLTPDENGWAKADRFSVKFVAAMREASGIEVE